MHIFSKKRTFSHRARSGSVSIPISNESWLNFPPFKPIQCRRTSASKAVAVWMTKYAIQKSFCKLTFSTEFTLRIKYCQFKRAPWNIVHFAAAWIVNLMLTNFKINADTFWWYKCYKIPVARMTPIDSTFRFD